MSSTNPPTPQQVDDFARESLLATTRLRMVAEKTQQLGETSTPDVFGSAAVSEAMAQLAATLSESLTSRAEAMEHAAHDAIAEMRRATGPTGGDPR